MDSTVKAAEKRVTAGEAKLDFANKQLQRMERMRLTNASTEEQLNSAQVSQVQEECQRDASAGQSLRISSRVEALQVEERSPQRIAVIASLDYSDQRLDAAGAAVGQPSTLKLRNRYVFARDGERWLLASYGEAD